MKIKVTLIVLVAMLSACTKSNTVQLSTALTSCPANNTCTYNYYENADFSDAYLPIAGHYQVFVYKTVRLNFCDAATTLFFKIPMSSSSFDFGAAQISTAQTAATGYSCACCDYVGNTKVIGGEIKGKSVGSGTWLINATVIQGDASGKPLDTLRVNQYFAIKSL